MLYHHLHDVSQPMNAFVAILDDHLRRALSEHWVRQSTATLTIYSAKKIFRAPLGPPRMRRGRVFAGCCHPRCNADLPDVISEKLSVDARTHTPVAPMVPMVVSSHRATAFPLRETGRRSTMSPSTASEGSSISGLQYSFPSFWPPRLLAAQAVPTFGVTEAAAAFTSQQNMDCYRTMHGIC